MKAVATKPAAAKRAEPKAPETAAAPVPSTFLWGGGAKSRSGCACGGGCPRCAKGAQGAPAGRAPAIVRDVLRAPGMPLPAPVRDEMQERFGHDLSAVRVHADSQAAHSASAVGAAAYTVGPHVVFSAGRYSPRTARGRHTLAHELVHVLQQRGATPSDDLQIGVPGDASEREADHIAGRIHTGAPGLPVQVRARSSVQTLRRQEHGVAAAIADGTMAPVSGVHGTMFAVQNCFGIMGCGVHFQFDEAYAGWYTRSEGGRRLNGVRVVIRANRGPACGSCDTLEMVQVLRDIRHGAGGATVAAEPSDPDLPPDITMTPELERMYRSRHLRSGWTEEHPERVPSHGWRVDAVSPNVEVRGYDPADPFYTHTPVGRAGTGGSDAVIMDTPFNYEGQTNVGREFQTCLVCVAGGTRSALGCVSWGMYIDASGAASFEPLPAATCGEPMELHDAAARWDSIEGNEDVRLQWHTPRLAGLPHRRE